MGGKNSREGSWRQSSCIWSTSSCWNQYEGSPLSPPIAVQVYPPQQYSGHYLPPQNYGTRPHELRRKLDRRHSRSADNYNNLEEVRSYATVQQSTSSYYDRSSPVGTAPPAPSSTFDNQDQYERSASSRWGQYEHPQASYPQESQSCAPQTAYPAYPSQHYSPPTQNYGTRPHEPQRKLDRRYSRIADNYNTLEEVTEALARAGLESSNLIVGIDFTKSNERTGARSFNRRSLHHIGDVLNPYEHLSKKKKNPYEQAISIIGKTLAAFDEDNLIPCFGFGDESTRDEDVFSFCSDERSCNGFEEVLSQYREIVPRLCLAGPTSFAPVIDMASTIVKESSGQYHVLLIIADGQVTRSVGHGQLSTQEQRTIKAIVEASKLPLSIILVGVGDGPWDMMKEFEDSIPARVFDNFQFVNFTEIMSKNVSLSRKETEFALAALMEIPSQYKAAKELNLLRGRKRVPLPPPVYGPPSFSNSKPSRSTSFQQSTSSYYEQSSPVGTAPPAPSSTFDNQVCPICLNYLKDMAFGCGHQTCCDCGQGLQECPICRSSIQTRIKLY